MGGHDPRAHAIDASCLKGFGLLRQLSEVLFEGVLVLAEVDSHGVDEWIQALRVVIPPLISQYLNITKNSSLAIAVGYMDVTSTLGGITLNQTGRAIECILLLMLFYLTISLLISGVMNVYNNSVKLKER